MNIAITSAGPTLDDAVFADFSQSPWLLIVNVESMECLPVSHDCTPGSDLKLAGVVLEHRCEAVITGHLAAGAFDILANDGVTRFSAGDTTVQQALQAMNDRQLQLIRNPQGTDSCSGSHHSGSCSGHHH